MICAHARTLCLVLILAGCTVAGPPAPPEPSSVPESVTLYRDTLTVVFDDGSLCAAPRPGGTPALRTGRLEGCSRLWGFRVLRGADRPRHPLGPDTAAPWVVLDSPDGPLGFAPVAAPSS